jgi:Flp pilus assembly protein CpaB
MARTTFSGPVKSDNGFEGAVTGNITGNVTGNLTGITIGTVTTRSGAGAVPITAATVQLTTTGANALTLANGTNGQMLAIVMVADGGDGTLTPTTKTGYTTITFDAVGDSVLLQYFTTLGWMIISNNGATVA